MPEHSLLRSAMMPERVLIETRSSDRGYLHRSLDTLRPFRERSQLYLAVVVHKLQVELPSRWLRPSGFNDVLRISMVPKKADKSDVFVRGGVHQSRQLRSEGYKACRSRCPLGVMAAAGSERPSTGAEPA